MPAILPIVEREFTAAPAAAECAPERVRPAMWAANVTIVVVPFLGVIAAGISLWGYGFNFVQLAVMVGMYLLSGFGITVGFHRLFAHRSFETSAPVKLILGIMGSLAVEGPVLRWVAQHRRHHQHSDQQGDPHSPYHHGGGLGGLLRGFWHAHVGWIFQPDARNLRRYIPDLTRSRLMRSVSRLFPLWALMSIGLPTMLGGLLTVSWTGALQGLLWGGFVRLFLVHHATWSIIWVCHLWGTQPFQTDDHSRNNFVFGVLGLGEGWHNNHHAFPSSATQGLRWWEIDVSYWVIRCLGFMGLAWNIKRPASSLIERPGLSATRPHGLRLFRPALQTSEEPAETEAEHSPFGPRSSFRGSEPGDDQAPARRAA